MSNTKFDKVNNALMESTYNTDNYIRLTKNVNAGHKHKYTTQNIITGNTSLISYKTLNEVIEEFNLKI